MQLGWAMHSVRLPELYEAARTGTLRWVTLWTIKHGLNSMRGCGKTQPALWLQVSCVKTCFLHGSNSSGAQSTNLPNFFFDTIVFWGGFRWLCGANGAQERPTSEFCGRGCFALFCKLMPSAFFSSGAKSSPFEPRSTRPKRGGQKRHKCFSCNDKTRQTYLEVSDGRLRDEEDRIQQICSKFFARSLCTGIWFTPAWQRPFPGQGPHGGQHELHTLHCIKRSQAAAQYFWFES